MAEALIRRRKTCERGHQQSGGLGNDPVGSARSSIGPKYWFSP
jgi:hypothetical protein